MSSIPRPFLEQLADRKGLTPDFEKPTFVERISNIEKSDELVARILNIGRDRYSSRMTKIYQKFNIPGKGPGKARILYYKVLDIFQREHPSDSLSLDIVNNAINNLVKSVQQKTQRLIHERCGYMQILDMSKPIDVQEIYTEVKITNQIASSRHVEIADLIKEMQKSESAAKAFNSQDMKWISETKFSGIEIVKHSQKLIIFGSPGAGKTTFLKYIAVCLNKSELITGCVPIFISLKDFQDHYGDTCLKDYVFSFFEKSNVLKTEADKLLLHSKVIFLLDGLDEVSEAHFSEVIKQIKELSQDFGNNRFIITCRLAAHEYKFENFIEAEVCDFTDEQIDSFVKNWFGAQKNPNRANRFLDRISNEQKIKELASNPLLLTLLCIVFGDSGDFPQNRAELYEEGLDVLLRKWDASRDIDRHQAYKGLSKSKKEDLLSQIAYVTFEENEGFFKQRMIENEIRNYIYNLPNAIKDPKSIDPDCKAILRSIVAQHGVIQEVARGIYAFSHRTFHEYFVSRKIVKTLAEDQKEILEKLADRINNHRWREVFLLVACTIQNADPLVLLIKEKIDFLLLEKENPKKFIDWLHQKTSSLKFGESEASELVMNSMSQVFYFNLVVEAKASATKLHQEFVIDSELMSILNHALFIQTNSAFIANLSSQQQINEAKKRQKSSYEALVFTLKNSIKRIKDSGCFQEEVGHLYKQISIASGMTEEWWMAHGEKWIDEFRSILMRHRNIGHKWNFTSGEISILRNYYNANRVLSSCLNSDCYISREVREEIKKSTLLPMNKIYLGSRN